MSKVSAVALLALSVAAARPQDPAPAPPAVPEQVAAVIQGAPRTTCTRQGIPGDLLNITLVGTGRELTAAFCAAGWSPADPITLRSSVGIATSVAFNRPYPQAPVSSLYLWGRKQDLAFEREVGSSARKRHHVRFWCSGATCPGGRPVWLGSAALDVSVGRSSTTGRITHHIAPDIDRERDTIVADLARGGRMTRADLVPRLGPTAGRNGGGDCYHSDGNMAVGVVAPGCPGRVDH